MTIAAPSIAVILLTYNQSAHTLITLRSLRDASTSSCRILLIDNASTDGTAGAVQASFPEVQTLRLERNAGCAGGRNVGLRSALEGSPSFLFFLDNDCLIERDTIPALIRAAERYPDAGIFTPKTFWWHQPTLLWSAGGVIDWKHGRTPLRGMNEPDRGQFDGDLTVDYAPGGFTFFRAEVARRIGDIDEDYFIYYEDPDWCLRAQRAGYACRFVPEARVWHDASRSVGGTPAFYYYRTRNRLLFMKRNARRSHAPSFWASFSRDVISTYYMLHRSGLPRQAQAVLGGIRAYLRHQWGPAPC